jgi:hypothetical protein
MLPITKQVKKCPTLQNGKSLVCRGEESLMNDKCTAGNTLLLSRVYEQKLASGDHAAADIVKDISPNAWQHVHMSI